MPEAGGLKRALACHSDWNDARSSLGNGLLNGWIGSSPSKDGIVKSLGGQPPPLLSGDRKRRGRRDVSDRDDGLVGVGICEGRRDDRREEYHRCLVLGGGGLPGPEGTRRPTAEAARWLLFVVASSASRPLMLPRRDRMASTERRPRDWRGDGGWKEAAAAGMFVLFQGLLGVATFSSSLGKIVHLNAGGVAGCDNMLAS